MDGIEHLDFEPGDPDDELGADADSPPEPNPSGNSALAQGSNVPLGWKPTPNAPVPVVRCTQIKKDGIRCGRWSLRGATKCYKHLGNGGALKNVEEHRKAVVEAAKLRLIDNADMALDTLEALMQPGSGEAIRLKAATETLDRAGVRGGLEITVDGEVTVSSADEIRKRLAGLKEGADEVRKMRAAMEAEADADIVDGEVIEDSEQLTLFDDESADES